MTDRPDPPIRALRSLPLAVVLGTAAFAIGMPFLNWLGLVIFRNPIPPRPVWVDFLAIKAVAGACAGAAAYAASRLPRGWLRTCLYVTLLFLLVEGEIENFASESPGYWLGFWVEGSLIAGVIFGTVVHLLYRRDRTRMAAGRQPGDVP